MCLFLLTATLSALAQDGASNIEFVENKGQWDKQVNFRGEIGTGAFFLQKQGFTVLLYNQDDLKGTSHGGGLPAGSGGASGPVSKTAVQSNSPISHAPGNDGDGAGSGGGAPGVPAVPGGLRSHVYRVFFQGSNEQAQIIPDKPLPSYNNYFIGSDPSKWAGNCKIYQGVTYKEIYPHVDIRYYSDKGTLKYDIIVHPGGDPAQVVMKYEGMDKLSTKNKELLISTSVGQVRELAPYSYQFNAEGKKPVACKYVVKDGNTMHFNVDKYAPDATLIIDPNVVFCTFTGSKASNWGFTATPGPGGTFFAGGIVFGNGFPVTGGSAYRGGEFDVGIIKFTSDGGDRLYATYLGGGDRESPHSMFSDEQGNLVVLGRTYSGDFPFQKRIGFQGGADLFVAKLNPAGNALLGCLVIGGKGNDCVNIEDQHVSNSERAVSLIRNYGDDSRSEVVLDGANNIYVAASTSSADFPIVGSVFQPKIGGAQDGVVLKIDPACKNLLWSSYLGGTGDDGAFVLKPDPVSGNLYVAGATTSSDFPGDKGGVIQGAFQGGTCDGFVTVISPDGQIQGKTTYLGTSQADAIYGIQVDKKGFPYVMGTTNGDWTVTPGVYSNAGSKQFVSKLQPNLSGYIYSTVFGSASNKPNISPVAFLVDRCENVYVSGWGGWIFPKQDPYGLAGTLGMPVTPDASKRVTDNKDFYFIVLKKNASDILYGTFFGQDDNANSISEHVDGGTSRYDQNGIIYQAICANCNGNTLKPFPTTFGTWSPSNGTGGHGCNLAALKIRFDFAGVAAGLKASVNGHANDTSGCIPLEAVLEDTVRNAKSYYWSYGDGSPDDTTTSYVMNHTYPNVGFYTVRIIAIDPNTCNGTDTAYRHIIARSDKAPLDFSYIKAPGTVCTLLEYVFTNLSKAPSGKPFGSTPFIWDFGDGSAQIPAGLGDIDYTFRSAGTYIVKLILNDTSYCNYPDTARKTLRISPNLKAQFVTPASGCAPYSAVFSNTSLGGQQFTWDFGDGSPVSTESEPTHEYPNIGTYTIKMHAVDTNTCNKVDDTEQTITVSSKPTSAFDFVPVPPVANTPMVFFNNSIGGVKYEWLFGDGSSLVKTNMDSVKHLYIRTDTFRACLVVFNEFGCTDTSCHAVATLIHPLLDVPNAFTPGRFGENGIIKVYGFGITHLIFRIYNRWGQIVFQTNDPNQGWDGVYNGVLQPTDVYAYTLEAEFSNGTRTHKKGDITLIR